MLPDRTPLPFEESVNLAKQAGFEEFDLGLSSRLLLEEDWEQRLEAMQEAIAQAGMHIRYVHTPPCAALRKCRNSGRTARRSIRGPS